MCLLIKNYIEISTIVAGMKYGQYISQYDMRVLASNSNQKSSSSQLLLGVNDNTAADKFRLTFMQNNNPDTSSTHAQTFLAWIKSKVRLGYAVTIAVYINGGENDEYDHIVPVHSIQSDYNDDLYHATDSITFNDNYLATNCGPYTFSSFQGTRNTQNTYLSCGTGGNKYALPKDSGIASYGIALTGVKKADSDVLFPVKLTANKNVELPVIQENSNTRPASSLIELTVTVSNLVSGVLYTVYKYTSAASVPVGNFNQNANKAASATKFTGPSVGNTYTFKDKIQSNSTAVYRCVKSDSTQPIPSAAPTSKMTTSKPTYLPSQRPSSKRPTSIAPTAKPSSTFKPTAKPSSTFKPTAKPSTTTLPTTKPTSRRPSTRVPSTKPSKSLSSAGPSKKA